MPHRQCRRSLAIFLIGMMCLFLWQAGIYPVLGQGNDNERSTISVVVRQGENLWNLAQKYHTSVEQLIVLNQIKTPNQIKEGQTLKIPNKNSAQVSETAAGASKRNLNVSWWVSMLRSMPVFANNKKEKSRISRSDNPQTAQKQTASIPTYEIVVNNDTTLNNQTSTKTPEATEGQIVSRSLGRLVSKEDFELLTRVIYGEARGEDFVGQVAVGAVVLNRLKDPRFPKTLRDIIYQAGAFTAVADKQIHLDPDDQAYKAAEAALSGEDPTNGAIYYYNPRIATDHWIKSRPVIKRIGNHTFSI